MWCSVKCATYLKATGNHQCYVWYEEILVFVISTHRWCHMFTLCVCVLDTLLTHYISHAYLYRVISDSSPSWWVTQTLPSNTAPTTLPAAARLPPNLPALHAQTTPRRWGKTNKSEKCKKKKTHTDHKWNELLTLIVPLMSRHVTSAFKVKLTVFFWSPHPRHCDSCS